MPCGSVERMISSKRPLAERFLDRIHRVVAAGDRALSGAAGCGLELRKCVRQDALGVCVVLVAFGGGHLGVRRRVRDEQMEVRRAPGCAPADRREELGGGGSLVGDDENMRRSLGRFFRDASLGRVLAGDRQIATTTRIAPRKMKLVTVVPSPRPPLERAWERKSPSEAPSGRVRM